MLCRILRLYAEENAIDDTVYYLGEALRKGIIELDVFLKVSFIDLTVHIVVIKKIHNFKVINVLMTATEIIPLAINNTPYCL